MGTMINRISVVVVANLFAALPHLSEAQVVPFQARGDNAQYSPVTGEYSGIGRGTHVGLHANRGQIDLPIVPTGNPGQFHWVTAEPHVITAADGSTISLAGTGLVQLIPLAEGLFSAVWRANFVVQGGTGRFANVGPGNGTIVVEAINDPFLLSDPIWTFSWTFNGTIDLGRRGRK